MINPMMMGSEMPQNGRGFNQGMDGNMGYNSMNSNWQQQNGGYGQQQNGWQQNGGWNGNQRRGYGGGYGGGDGGGENGAYARGPVNPNRARGRQQRQARNNDYNTL
jgi:hypothetical protein